MKINFYKVLGVNFTVGRYLCSPEQKIFPQWMPTGMRSGNEVALVLYNGADGNSRLGTLSVTLWKESI